MSPALPVTEIGPRDAALQTAFCDYVPQVFRRVDFRRWCEWGEWNDDYRAYAVLEDGRVVANVYPRFGFEPWPQTLFAAMHEAVPEGPPAPKLDLEDAKVRAELATLSREGLPVTERFGARDYATIASWYSANGFARPLRRLGADAWVFADVEGDTLYLDDIFAREPFDLRAQVPRLIERPIRSIRFGFTPERWWPGAVEAGEDLDADLFVRKLSLSRKPHRFPVLART